MTVLVAFSNSGLAARPSHRRVAIPTLLPSLGVSSLDCRLPLHGVGGLFGSVFGSRALPGADPSEVSSAAFPPSSHIALPRALGRFSGRV